MRTLSLQLCALAFVATWFTTASWGVEALPTSPYDDLWSHAVLYQSKDNPILQEFALQGRLQVQYAVGSSDQGNFTSGNLQDLGVETWGNVDLRRCYMGFKSTLFHDFNLQGQAIVNPDWGPVYGGIFDLYALWGVSDQLQIYTGKVTVKFTREFEISSREIVTLERSLLVNQLAPGQLTGAWANGKKIAGFWNYELGIFGSDIQEELTEFQGGAILLAKIGYDFAEASGWDRALVGLHGMHSTDPGDAGAKPYENSFALTGDLKKGRWAATADLVYANGRNDFTGNPVPNVWGLSLIPTYDITEKLQLVARYQFACSDGDNGLSLQKRYERTAPDFIGSSGATVSGNQYQAFYLGVNYYFYGQKLKLMSGLEYAEMEDNANDGGEYDGWTWTSGLRMYF